MIALESEFGTEALRPRRSEPAELRLPQSATASPVPTYGRPRLLLASGLRRTIAAFRERTRAARDYPEATGATDRELVWLSLNPDRVANSVRDANLRMCDLTLARYR